MNYQNEWISWVAAATAVLGGATGVIALWRSGRVRVLDRRTEFRREAAELRVELGDLLTEIEAGKASRRRIAAMNGQAGALQHFLECAEADIETVKGLQRKLADQEPIPFFTGYGSIGQRLVIAQEVSTRLKLMRPVYAKAAAADDEARRDRRSEVMAQVSRSLDRRDT
jgi:hypothetical protein